jgi:hypothetical protein
MTLEDIGGGEDTMFQDFSWQQFVSKYGKLNTFLKECVEQGIWNNPIVRDRPPAKRVFEIEGYI